MADIETIALRAPTPFLKLAPWAARSLLLVVGVVILWGAVGATTRELVSRPGKGEDIALYAAIVEDMRVGTPYYTAAEIELRRRGYAMSSVFNWRLPTLAWMFLAVRSDRAARAVLVAVAVLALLLWYAAARRSMRPAVAAAVCAAVLGILGWPFLGDAYLVHGTWAGVAIALSIAASALGLVTTAVVAGLAALAIRELAIVHVLVASLFALRARRSREAIAWIAGVAIFSACYLLHAWAVGRHQLGTDHLQSASWLSFGGWWFVLKTALLNAWMILVPGPLLAVVWPLSLLGLLAWPGRLGQRTAATVLAYLGAFLVVGLPYNHLWGLLYAGLALPGLLFTPAALRDLWCQARPR